MSEKENVLLSRDVLYVKMIRDHVLAGVILTWHKLQSCERRNSVEKMPP